MERGFLSQKESGRGRGVKEKDLNGNKKNTSSCIGVSTVSEDSMNDDSPTGYAPAVREGVTPFVVDMTVEMGKQNSLDDTTVPGSFPPLSTPVSTTAGNAPGKSSYANITSKPSGKSESYGFFLGKKVAYPVVANYVRNTWGKYGLVRSMFSSSTGLFSFQFSSMDGLDAMLENGPWSSYARVMVELKADVELKDNIVVAMPKITREGHYTCNVRVEYEWKPPRCSSCKVFGHVHEECTMNTGAGEKKTVKKPSQTSRGVPVGLKIGFKPQKEYRPVTKKPTASSSGNKKKGVEPTIEVSNSNPFDVLNSVDNDGEFVASNTPYGAKIDKIERQIGEGKLRLLDNDGNPLVPTGIVESDSEVELVFDETANLRIPTSGKDGSDKGYGTNSLLEQWRDSYPDNVDYDPYDDDMYENHDLSEHLQSICDDLDITVHGRKKK
ncbi:retrovirus-related pol polyprotein from transposon TNT 1-94 [Tanacetum coccineum]